MISQSTLILGSTNWSKNTLTDQSMGIHDATVQREKLRTLLHYTQQSDYLTHSVAKQGHHRYTARKDYHNISCLDQAKTKQCTSSHQPPQL